MAPSYPVAVHRLPVWEIPGQHPPLATCLQQIKYRTKHVVGVHRRRFGGESRNLQHRFDFLELLQADVAVVGNSHPTFLRATSQKINWNLRKITNRLLQDRLAHETQAAGGDVRA